MNSFVRSKFAPFVIVLIPIGLVVGLTTLGGRLSPPTEATVLDSILESFSPVTTIQPLPESRSLVTPKIPFQGNVDVLSEGVVAEPNIVVVELEEEVIESTMSTPFLAGISHNEIPFENFDVIENLQQDDEPFFVLYFQDWATSSITTRELDLIAREGHIPVISWEPHEFSVSFGTEIYSLDDIADGVYDDLIKDDFEAIGRHDGIVYLRFAHEFNEGSGWYPWSIGINGNTAEQYVDAWRHLVELSEEYEADNIRWIWSPNATNFLPQNTLEAAYPGDQYVDMVGIVGYLGPLFPTFEERFDETIIEIRDFSDKPIIITETGAAPNTPNRNDAVCQYMLDLQESEDVIGFVWFDKNAREDWRIADAEESFKSGLQGNCPTS